MNKRRIILIVILLISGAVLSIKHWQSQQPSSKHQPPRDDIERLLDNGIQFSELVKKKQFLNDIKISNVKINEQKITYTIQNASKNSVFLSNQLQIGNRITLVSTTDIVDKKIELRAGEEKTLELTIGKQEVSKILDGQIDENNIRLLKPIYQKYDSPTLIGVAKYEATKQ
jgi:hypothetical protein